MRKLFTTFLFSLLIVAAYAQGTIKGQVVDAETGDGLIGATVLVQGTYKGAATDFEGYFTLEGVPAGPQTIQISYTGFSNFSEKVDVDDDEVVEMGIVKLNTNAIGLEEVKVVAAIARDRRTPVAVSNIDAEEIEAKLGNQEFPEILRSTPSIYATKTGGGFGDARITVRGFSQENVALLINGIPVNGMEDNRIYWSNWAGLGDVTRTIQVQRGMGASRLAVASVGGTINILTKTTDQEKGGTVSTAIGNDGYRKTGLTLSTGRTEGGWAFTFSGSRTTGDGYIEGTYIDAWSYFLSIAKEIGDNQQLLFTVFGAPQRHGQRDFQHSLTGQKDVYGLRWNDDFGYYQGQEFLIRENFYHKPQASLNHIWQINSNTSLITAVYGSVGRGGGTGDLGGFVRGDGAYRSREFRQPRDAYGHHQYDEWRLYNQGQTNALYDTSMAALNYVIGTDNVAEGDTMSGQIASQRNGLIKRASMNEHNWYGILSTLNTSITSNITFTGGLDLRWYNGRHYRKTVDLFGADYWFEQDNINNTPDWVDLNGDGLQTSDELGRLVRPTNDADRLWGAVDRDQRIDYNNDEDINWYGAFAQLEYTEDKLSAFVSGAVNLTTMRRYDFFQKRPADELTDWFNYMGGNAKAGVNYNINETNNVFLNVGYISRAPYFDALFPTFNNDEVNEDVENEKVFAVEGGYGLRQRNFRANLNAYFMQWQDKTEVEDARGDDGELLVLNLLGVDAQHSGIELDFEWRATSALNIRGYASLNNWEWQNNPTGNFVDQNQNPVGDEVTLFIDGLKVGDAAQTTAGIGLSYNFGSGLSADIQFNYFDDLYASYEPLDRTDETEADTQPLQLDSYNLVDLGFTWNFTIAGMDATARVNVNNLFDEEYIAEATDASDIAFARGWYGFGRTWNAGLRFNF